MDIGRLSAPYLLGPVIAMAQLVNVSRPGEEPDPSQPISEDMRLFDPTLTDSKGDTLLTPSTANLIFSVAGTSAASRTITLTGNY